MENLLHPIIDWIARHPHLAGLGVFGIALAESLVVVGLIVPGTAVMFAVGALIASGALSLGSTLAWAVLGAIAGDGISFWLGYRYRDRLRGVWPFRRHPEWFDLGESFLQRHGGKSILLGRFVGPVRPVIPVVAGIIGMRPRLFLLANVVSALLWAPVYLAPGIGFGALVDITGRVAARLAMLLVLLLVLLWFSGWVTHQLHVLIAPRAARLSRRLARWSGRGRGLRRVLVALLDARHAESRGLVLAGGVLIAAGIGLVWALESALGTPALVRVDTSVYQVLQHLRSPWGDRIMIAITTLGGVTVVGAMGAWVLLWLLWRRSWRSGAYWSVSVVAGVLLAGLVQWLLRAPRPSFPAAPGFSVFALPSGYATVSVTAYGFLAVMSARAFSPSRRWMPYASAAMVVVAVAFSRLYLGASWLSDVVAGTVLGFLWTLLLGTGYRVHVADPGGWRGFGVGLLAVVLGVGIWHFEEHSAALVERYRPREIVRSVTASQWWHQGWRELPSARIDLQGGAAEPLDVQWAGSLDELRARLHASGWHLPPPLTLGSAVHWFEPHRPLAALPLLPHLHAGRYESLALVRPDPSGSGSLVLRLWPSSMVLRSGVPVWVGSVGELHLYRPLGILAIPRTGREFDRPLRLLADDLRGLDERWAQRLHHRGASAVRWSGAVLLIRSALHPEARCARGGPESFSMHGRKRL